MILIPIPSHTFPYPHSHTFPYPHSHIVPYPHSHTVPILIPVPSQSSFPYLPNPHSHTLPYPHSHTTHYILIPILGILNLYQSNILELTTIADVGQFLGHLPSDLDSDSLFNSIANITLSDKKFNSMLLQYKRL
jgi:hypothetical protein